MIGRMLFAIISGQMLGSFVSGIANDAFGWRSALAIGTRWSRSLSTAVAWLAMPRRPGRAIGRPRRGARLPRSTAACWPIRRRLG